MTKAKNDPWTEGMLLFVMLVWAANFSVSKWILTDINFFVYNFLRFAVAALVFLIALPYIKNRKKFEKQDYSLLGKTSIVVNLFYQGLFILGLGMTSAGNSAVIISTAPLFTLLLNALLFRERIAWVNLLFIIISLIGIILMIFTGPPKLLTEVKTSSVAGDLITLGAAACWALYTVIQQPLVSKYPPLQVTAFTIISGAVILFFPAIPYFGAMDWGKISPEKWAGAIASGALSIGLAYFIWSKAISKIGPVRTAQYNNIVVVFAYLISMLVLQESHTWSQHLGAGLTVAGVWGARFLSLSKKSK